jgi:transposase
MGQGNFTEDFRLDAIKQITERGHSVADVSKRLGVSTHSLYSWMKRYAVSPAAVLKDDRTAEIRRLKQELARVTEERDILKNDLGHRPSCGGRNRLCYCGHAEG